MHHHPQKPDLFQKLIAMPLANRRTFFTATFAEAALLTSTKTTAQESSRQWISIIDLDRCDGCVNQETPACVNACRQKNQARFPKPQKPLKPYWPQKKFEDFSDQQELTSRLTPYNWLYIQKIQVDQKTVFLPRRCMHCFDAPCRKLCPFGAIDKSPQGAVSINESVCFGGAKCRDVCPWEIPQRQAGVGIYLKAAPTLAGGGVMFKCDFCHQDLAQGKTPSCATACPQKAIYFGPLEAMKKTLTTIRQNRFVYGVEENGGTATWYVSSVSFAAMDKALEKEFSQRAHQGEPRLPKVTAHLDDSKPLALATVAAPVVAVVGALLLKKRPTDSQKKNVP